MTHLFTPWFQAEDGNGVPRSGATLDFYVAATTTPITVYADSAKGVSLGSTVTADAAGVFQPIWVDTAAYKTVLKTSAGVTVQTVDNIAAPAASASPVLTTPQINDTSATHQYVFAVNELAADRTVTLPLLAANDTFAFNDFAATLKNKTLEDSTTFIADNSDPTKKIAFQASSITTATTRTVTVPDVDVTLMPIATATQIRAKTAAKALSTDNIYSAAAEVALTYAATVAVDFSTGINFTLTLTGNAILGQPSNLQAGQSGRFRVTQDGTGSRLLTYHADYEFAGSSAVVLSTAAAAQDILYYDCIAANRILISAVKAIG